MVMAPRVALVGGIVLLLGLAGCRTRPATAPVIGPGADAPWPVQREQLRNLDRYSLAGRVAVTANGEGFTASLRFAQSPDESSMALDGPLGIGGLRVSQSRRGLRMTTSKGEELDGLAAAADLEKRLGVALPFMQLRWWLLGVPAPGDVLVPLDQDPATGEIRGFNQDGWRIDIQSRAPGLGFALPKKLTAEHEGAKVKLVVDQWQP